MSTYVYAFTGASHPLPIDGLAGVGERKPALRLVRQDGLAAVVSDAPENLRAKRRDVEAHERVLDTLLAAGTVLPMRFGTVAADDDAVKAELASEAKRYTRLLRRLGGKVEVNVKAVHREEAVLRELLLGDRELRKRSEALRASGGGSQQDQVAFGQQVSAALDARRSQDADRVVAELRPRVGREARPAGRRLLRQRVVPPRRDRARGLRGVAVAAATGALGARGGPPVRPAPAVQLPGPRRGR